MHVCQKHKVEKPIWDILRDKSSTHIQVLLSHLQDTHRNNLLPCDGRFQFPVQGKQRRNTWTL